MLEMIIGIFLIFFVFGLLFKLGIGLLKVFLALIVPILVIILIPFLIIPFFIIFAIGFVIFALIKVLF